MWWSVTLPSRRVSLSCPDGDPVRASLRLLRLAGLALLSPLLAHAQTTTGSVPTTGDTTNCVAPVLSSTRYGTDPRGAIAIGCNSEANAGGVVVGTQASANIDATAIGNHAVADDNSVALGAYASANSNAVAIFGSAVSNSLAIYGNTASANSINIYGSIDSYSYGDSTNSLVLGGYVGGKSTTALGMSSQALNGGTAVGASANAAAKGLAVGTSTTSTAGGIALGYSVKAKTGVAIGSSITQSGTGLTGVLIGNTVTGGTQSVAIGNATSAVDGSVAIGNGSQATLANQFSVGSAATSRTVSHVSAGKAADDASTIGQINQLSGYLGSGVAFTNGVFAGPALSVYSTTSKATVSATTVTDAIGTLSGSVSNLDTRLTTAENNAARDPNLTTNTPSGGHAATVTSTGATGSVALGTNSVADQDGTVSVGSAATQRRVVNLAAGTQDTDAATIGQVNQLASLFGGGTTFSNGTLLVPSFAQFNSLTHTAGTSASVTDAFSTVAGSLANLDSRVSTLEAQAPVPGPPGPQGDKGDPGTPGAQGAAGSAGPQGDSGLNGTDGKDGLNGANGTNGVNGKDGDSAYQVALSQGFQGTQAQWLAALKAAPAVTGATADAQAAHYDAGQNSLTLARPDGTPGAIALHHVADGAVAEGSQDAVNGGQLYTSEQANRAYTQAQVQDALTTSRAYTDTQVQAAADWSRGYTDARIHQLDRKLSAQSAMSQATSQAAAALAGVDTRFRNRWATGVGSTGGRAANSVLFQHVSESGRTSWNAGAAVSQGGQSQVGVGYAAGF